MTKILLNSVMTGVIVAALLFYTGLIPWSDNIDHIVLIYVVMLYLLGTNGGKIKKITYRSRPERGAL